MHRTTDLEKYRLLEAKGAYTDLSSFDKLRYDVYMEPQKFNDGEVPSVAKKDKMNEGKQSV